MRLRHTLVAAALALSIAAPLAAQQQPTGEKPAAIAAIPGVIAQGAKWERIWQGPFNADGMSAGPDGSLLFGQEQANAVMKLWPDGRTWVAWPYIKGAGAVSVDAAGRVAQHDAGAHRVVALAEHHRGHGDGFADGGLRRELRRGRRADDGADPGETESCDHRTTVVENRRPPRRDCKPFRKVLACGG